jgi:hypothetical protein
MKTWTITFNGTDDKLQAAAVANGYTGTHNDQPETVEQFFSRYLVEHAPYEIVKTATMVFQQKLGTDNYDADQMANDMLNLITITPDVV